APDPAGKDQSQVFLSNYSKGRELKDKGQLDEAIRHYEAAHAVAPSVLADQRSLGLFLNNLAMVYQDARRFEKAEESYQQSLQLLEGASGPNSPDVETLLDNFGQLHMVRRRYDQAEAAFRRSLAIREQKAPPDHLELSISLNNLASVCEARGQS